MSELVSEMLNLMLPITTYLSMIIMVFGVMQFVLAFKDEDADRKARGVMLIVTGSAMAALRPIMNILLNKESSSPAPSTPVETPTPSFDLDLSFITAELVIGVIVVVALVAIGIIYKKIEKKEKQEKATETNLSNKGE